MVLRNVWLLLCSILSIGLVAMSILSINSGAYIFGVLYLTLGCGVYLVTFQCILDDGEKRRKRG